jgi:hypothetical protein
MILLIFAASMLVSILLERQARQHGHERAIEYERLGIPISPRRPKLKRAEAWLNAGLGLILVALSLMSISTGFLMRSMAEKFPDHAAELTNDFSQAIQNAAFLLASGMALAWLGWKAIREITRYESGGAAVPRARG